MQKEGDFRQKCGRHSNKSIKIALQAKRISNFALEK